MSISIDLASQGALSPLRLWLPPLLFLVEKLGADVGQRFLAESLFP